MPDLSKDMKALINLLAEHGVDFAVCGGHAVAHHGYPRMTMDMDLLITPGQPNADRMMAVLKEFGFENAGIPKEAFMREGTAVTLGVQPNQVDLLTSISREPTSAVMQRTVDGELAGMPLRFVGLADLIEAKRQAGRPKDLADLDELLKFSEGQEP